MVRSAAKNHDRVGIVVNPARYDSVIAELKESGELRLQTKRLLALEAFQHTAQYDAAISHYLSGAFGADPFSGEIAFGGQKDPGIALWRKSAPESGFLSLWNPNQRYCGQCQTIAWQRIVL